MQTHCSRCHAAMTCGANDKPSKNSCWCVALPVLPPSAYNSAIDCLCPTCLQIQLNAGVVLYGIPNCDTVKKARAWLDEYGIAYAFWDYKKHGVPQDTLNTCLQQHGWQQICNTRGPTWRNIPELVRTGVVDAPSALPVLVANPSAIKRPIVSWGNTYGEQVTVGFNVAIWQGIIKISC